MQSLAAILNDVRSGRRPPWPCHPNPSTFYSYTSSIQTQHLSEEFQFGSNPGNLRMLKYVPRGLRHEAPLVVLLHGCRQTAADIDRGTGWSKLASERGFALLVPEQRLSNNAQRGFNWFQPTDTACGRGEAASIRQMIEFMIVKYRLNPGRIYVTGLSAGGAMTAALLSVFPDIFAGGAIIAGLPFGVASNLWDAVAAMKGEISLSSTELAEKVREASKHRGTWPRLSIWHGSSDKTVAPSNAGAIARQWCEVHGISEQEAVETRIAGQVRLCWRDASGRPLVEKLVIDGMGHGVPIDGRRRWHYGQNAAPFVEEVGLSSTHHIASFWGL
jgi:poly(hydroxyalkanoate) depolymerase family esterase